MDLELEKFKTEIDLRAYAATQQYSIDRKESWAGSCVMRHPNNDKIIIKRDADGHWVFFSVRDDTDNGTVIDFAKRRLSLSLGAIRKELRAFMGLPPSILVPHPPLPRVAKDRIRVERAYAGMQTARRHPYLENERGIPRQVLESRRFAGKIRIDRHGNAVFPHIDAGGLSGFEIKNHGLTSFSTGGSKAIWSSHVEYGDNRIVFCESAIDALSLAALEPGQRTRYASIGGRPSPNQKRLIRDAVSVLPASNVVIAAMDADAAGRELAEVVREAVKLTGRSDLRFEIHEPPAYKDWNDFLLQKKRCPLPCRVGQPSITCK